MNSTTLLNILIILAGVGYGVGQWRNGKVKQNDDVINSANNTIDLLNNRIAAQDEKIKTQDEKINTLELENKTQREELLKLSERVQIYKEVLQNRNPEMIQFMDMMTKSAENQAKFQENSAKIWASIQTELAAILKAKTA